jgi:LAS superfamily LD-carboxypeptidase LdcB
MTKPFGISVGTTILLLSLFLVFACGYSSPQEETGAAKTETAQLPSSAPAPKAAVEPLPLKYVVGQFEPGQDSNFVRIEAQYTNKTNIYLHKETYSAFLRMYEAAKKDSITLRILSATRNFNSQKSIWEAKWTGQRKLSDGTNAAEIADKSQRALRILEYSSMPGTSRHHWGTDIDLNSLNNAFFEKEEGLRIYKWLTTHASTYGFCQPYSPKGANRPNGYNEEKWHWSYLPLAKRYLKAAKDSLKDSDISGFEGAEVAPILQVVKNYILGINEACL